MASRTHPPALLHRAVGVAVQAGENGAGRHHFVGLVPAVGVAEPAGVALALLIQDGVQPGPQDREQSETTSSVGKETEAAGRRGGLTSSLWR